MLTLHDLTTGSDPLLAHLDQADARLYAVRAVEHARTVEPPALTPGALRRGTLAVLPPGTPDAGVARALAGQGAAAVVLAGPGPQAPDAAALSLLAQACAAEHLPLLVPVRPAPAAAVVEAANAAMRRAATAHAQRTASLLHLVDRLYRADAGPDALVPHLAEITGAGIYLATPGSTGWTLLTGDGCREALLLARRQGVRSAVVSDSGQHIVLTPVGHRAPHPVLTGVREAEAGPWPAHLRETLTLAATQAALLRHPLELRAREDTWRRGRRTHRTGIMQALMLGQWEAAVRMAAPDTGLHLTGREAVMAVVSCSPRAREELTQLCEEGLPHALVVQCPAYPDHVLVTAPALDGDGRSLHTALAGLLAGHRHRGVGISTPAPWDRIPHAYAAARQALAAAQPGTLATHSGTADLAAALATVPGATRWARRVVSMAAVGEGSRRLDLARLALTAGIPGAASLTRADRAQVRRSLVEVMVRLGLDHREMPHRAVAELAFQLAALDDADHQHVHGEDGAQDNDAPPMLCGLDDLLFSDAARDWANAALRPLLDAEAPPGGWLGPKTTHPLDTDPLALLVLYVTVGCSVSSTANGLGLSRRSTRTRLAAAAAALGRPITDTRGCGPHSALWALIAGGHLPPTYTPDPAGPVYDLRAFIPQQLTATG